MIKWLRDILDSEKSPSFGRAGTAFIVCYLVAAGMVIVVKTFLIPDVPMGWVTIIGILWGGSSLKEAYIKGKVAPNGGVADNTQPAP